MPVTEVQFAIQSNPGRYGQDGTALLVNCYAEDKGREGKSGAIIYASQGLDLFTNEPSATLGTRGLLPLDDALYWVVDKELRKVDGFGTTTRLGGISDTGRVSMSRNSKANTPQIAIVTRGGETFIVEDDILSPLNDPDLPPPNSTAFLDGRTYYGISNGEIYYSEINDAGNISALAFTEAESEPDGLATIFTLGRQLFAMGTRTVQPFQTTANADNPLAPLRGGTIQIGCLAGGTVRAIDSQLIWVADDWTVRLMPGYSARTISNSYIQELIQAEPDPTNMTGDVYAADGHQIYVLSGTSFTVEYNAGTGLWNNRESSLLPRWRGQIIAPFQGKYIVGDKDNGNLYQLDPLAYDENGEDMTMVIRSALIHNSPNRLQYRALWLDYVTGVGLNTQNEDANPQVAMRHSDDGGFTWSNERQRSLGRIGERKKRVKFNKLGTEREKGRVFETRVSAAVVRSFMAAFADLGEVRT